MERSTPHAAAGTWALSDGRAGNARQAQALAQALDSTATDWELTPRAPWQWLAPRRVPGASHAFGPAFAAALTTPPALAIGCGRQAALATRLLRGRGSATVQILDPRMAASHWDIVVAPIHDALRGDNVVQVLGSLHPVNDSWLARMQAEFMGPGQLQGPRTAVLLGGPTRHASFSTDDVAGWLAAITVALDRSGGSVMLCASRRTPAAMRGWLRSHVAAIRGRPGLLWLDDSDGANPYPGVLAWADCIVCSPDSVNMLSEACATRAPVFVADPQRASGRIRNFIDTLASQHRILPLDDALAPFAVEPLRETSRVAAEVRTRLTP